MTRKELHRHFSSYPDVVTLKQFQDMLGGISDTTARKLVNENRVMHFMIRTTIYIPKISIIDYIQSPHYKKYNKLLKHHID